MALALTAMARAHCSGVTYIEGFLFISQLAIKQMLAQKTGGSIVNITASLADHPIAGVDSAVPMITKGGLEAATRSLAMEYAKQGIRVNAVAPVDTSARCYAYVLIEVGHQRGGDTRQGFL